MWVSCDVNFVQKCNYTLFNSTFYNNLGGLAGGMMKFNYYQPVQVDPVNITY